MKILVDKTKRKDGVALLIVLGMLALLLVMAATFSITMRTERIGAGNYASSVMGKQMVQAALADAIARIDEVMVDKTNGMGELISSSDYPLWEVMGSVGGVDSAKLAWGEALEHIPGVYRDAAVRTNSYWLAAATTNYGGTLVGRRAYLIVNCSGLLDANYAGGENRTNGTSPFELQLDNLSEFSGGLGDITAFYNDCGIHKRYESVDELLHLNYGLTNFIGRMEPFHFVVNSYFPPGYNENGTLITDQVDLDDGTLATIKAKYGPIRAKFTEMGLDADFVYENLIDYLDKDNIPGNLDGMRPGKLDSPCTELVPMLNEVVINGSGAFKGFVGYGPVPASNKIIPGYAGPAFLGQFPVVTELVFPFINPSSDKFTIERDVTGSSITVGGTTKAIVDVDPNKKFDIGYNGEVNRFYQVAPQDQGEYILFGVEDSTGTMTNAPYTITIKLKFIIRNSDGDIVDQVPADNNGSFTYTTSGNVSEALTGPKFEPMKGWEVVDPRFNWSVSNWRVPADLALTAESIGKTNSLLTEWFFPSAKGKVAADMDTAMYVSNAEKLYAVEELGHLLRGKSLVNMLHTIRLFDTPLTAGSIISSDKVNKYFKLKGKSERGLVNLNTEFEEVFNSAFTDMPIGYPNNPNSHVIFQADITSIYNSIQNEIYTNGPLKNLDDIGTLDWATILPDSRWNSAERDSMFALSGGLLGTRQNLFTIILAGGPYSMGMGLGSASGNWLSSQRAVAVVWRDPIPAANGKHPFKVLYFKWLDD